MYESALRLARDAAEQYIKHGVLIDVPDRLPAVLMQQRACYVTLFEKPGRHIRAVFGRPTPSRPTLAHEVVFNTAQAIYLSSSARIRKADIPYLAFSVGIVGPLERILAPEHLDPAKFGLYVLSDRGKSTVILPERTGIDTGDEQISTAFREADIIPSKEAVTMYRFSVEHYD